MYKTKVKLYLILLSKVADICSMGPLKEGIYDKISLGNFGLNALM